MKFVLFLEQGLQIFFLYETCIFFFLKKTHPFMVIPLLNNSPSRNASYWEFNLAWDEMAYSRLLPPLHVHVKHFLWETVLHKNTPLRSKLFWYHGKVFYSPVKVKHIFLFISLSKQATYEFSTWTARFVFPLLYWFLFPLIVHWESQLERSTMQAQKQLHSGQATWKVLSRQAIGQPER